MALDKLVDSAQLDSDLTSVADAIRAKSGGSSQLAFPAGFVSEIQAIPSGGGGYTITGISDASNTLTFGQSQGVGSSIEVTGDVTLNFPDKYLELIRLFHSAKLKSGATPGKLTINCKGFGGGNNYPSTLCYRSRAFNEVELNFSVANYAALGTQCFQGTNCTIKKIHGTPIALTKNVYGSYKMFNANDIIEEVSFYENLSAQTVDFGSCSAFKDSTLVSIANGLQVSTGSATLTLHSTPKGRLASIMGTVSQVTRDSETYDKFTADANGTVTLQDFITKTKGWTLA